MAGLLNTTLSRDPTSPYYVPDTNLAPGTPGGFALFGANSTGGGSGDGGVGGASGGGFGSFGGFGEGDSGTGDPDTGTVDSFGGFLSDLAQGVSMMSGPLGFSAGLFGAKDGHPGTVAGLVSDALSSNNDTSISDAVDAAHSADPSTDFASQNTAVSVSADMNSGATNTSGPTDGPNAGVDAGWSGADDGSGGDGGGGGSSSVVCTELRRLDCITLRTWAHAEIYGSQLPAWLMRGYRVWAGPLVSLTRRSPRARRIVIALGRPWAAEMERRQRGRGRATITGRAVLYVGLGISAVVGAFILLRSEHGTRTAPVA